MPEVRRHSVGREVTLPAGTSPAHAHTGRERDSFHREGTGLGCATALRIRRRRGELDSQTAGPIRVPPEEIQRAGSGDESTRDRKAERKKNRVPESICTRNCFGSIFESTSVRLNFSGDCHLRDAVPEHDPRGAPAAPPKPHDSELDS